jgi:NADH:ubiquinone oxidoreductase subunit E
MNKSVIPSALVIPTAVEESPNAASTQTRGKLLEILRRAQNDNGEYIPTEAEESPNAAPTQPRGKLLEILRRAQDDK